MTTLFFDMDGTLIDSAVGITRCVEHAMVQMGLPVPPHEVYAGIGETIEALHAAGHRLAVVTAKNEPHARKIVDHLPFGHRFDDVIGATLDGRISHKDELIAEALRRFALNPGACWMIGDRRMDIEGARHHGMRNIGVLWGFGGEAELREAGALHLAAAPRELPTLLAA